MYFRLENVFGVQEMYFCLENVLESRICISSLEMYWSLRRIYFIQDECKYLKCTVNVQNECKY